VAVKRNEYEIFSTEDLVVTKKIVRQEPKPQKPPGFPFGAVPPKLPKPAKPRPAEPKKK